MDGHDRHGERPSLRRLFTSSLTSGSGDLRSETRTVQEAHNAIALTGFARLMATWNRRYPANGSAGPTPPEGGGRYPGPRQDPQAVERPPRHAERSPGRSWGREVALARLHTRFGVPEAKRHDGPSNKSFGSAPARYRSVRYRAGQTRPGSGSSRPFLPCSALRADMHPMEPADAVRTDRDGARGDQPRGTKEEGSRPRLARVDTLWPGVERYRVHGEPVGRTVSGALPPAAVDSPLRPLSVTPFRA